VAGGRVGLAIDPGLLGWLGSSRTVALVSGTNGKTTTTALLTAALGADGAEVASNATGSNMPAGHVAALAANPTATRAVLEVDEGYLDAVLTATGPLVVVLLNLSRDQLDRMSEVRMLAERWDRALAGNDEVVVVANADDPLVAFAARQAPSVVWVAGGLAWEHDAAGCPLCGGHIDFDPSWGWRCDGCSFSRPTPAWHRDAASAYGPHGSVPLEITLPGSFNRDNALMALAAAEAFGVDPRSASAALSRVTDVAGRFISTTIGGASARLMLAKNPAGWSALLDLVADDAAPVVVAINSRIADGADPSWLYDVDFGALRGRRVVATGDRWRDLSVRLHYAEVEHDAVASGPTAVAKAAKGYTGAVDVIGNYTAFSDLRGAAR